MINVIIGVDIYRVRVTRKRDSEGNGEGECDILQHISKHCRKYIEKLCIEYGSKMHHMSLMCV